MTGRALDTRASEGWLFGTGLRMDPGRTWPLRLEHWVGSKDRGSGRRAPMHASVQAWGWGAPGIPAHGPVRGMGHGRKTRRLTDHSGFEQTLWPPATGHNI